MAGRKSEASKKEKLARHDPHHSSRSLSLSFAVDEAFLQFKSDATRKEKVRERKERKERKRQVKRNDRKDLAPEPWKVGLMEKDHLERKECCWFSSV